MSDERAAEGVRIGRFRIRVPSWIQEIVKQTPAIVVGILLALWVDQWKGDRADRELEVTSLQNFLTEIQRNEARINDVLPYHKGMRKMLAQLDSTHGIHTPAEYQNAVGIDGLRTPSLLETAWITAVSTNALTKFDYETVSALSLTYKLQDRFREDSRNGMQSVLEAGNFGTGGAGTATRIADNYMTEVVANEDELRATYAEAERVLRKKLVDMGETPSTDPGKKAP